MMARHLIRRGICAQIVLLRFDWIKGLAWLLLTIGVIGWLWLMPRWQAELHREKSQLSRLQSTAQLAAPASPKSHFPDAQRLTRFYETLGDTAHAEQPLKTLFVIAARNGLTLAQADYQAAADRRGQYSVYQIALPVKGPYPAIRAFCEQTLLAIPYAALDEIRFKRDAIASTTLEAQIRLSLYLRDGGPAPSVVSVPEGQP